MPLRRLTDSIITRMLILITFLACASSVIRYFAVDHLLHQNLGSIIEGQQLSLANYVAKDIDDKIIQRQSVLGDLARALGPRLLQHPEQLQAWLRVHYHYQRLFDAGLYVADRKGKVIAQYPRHPQGRNDEQRDFITAVGEEHAQIGSPRVDLAIKRPVLPIAVAIQDGPQHLAGTLVGMTTLDAPGFLDLLQQARIGNGHGGFLLVAPQQRILLASSEADVALKPVPAIGSNLILDRAMAGFRGTDMSRDNLGKEDIAAIASVPSTGWFVMAHLPGEEAFATIKRVQQFAIHMILLACLLFIALASAGLYYMLRPLFQAANDAERMTQGKLPLLPLKVRRADEIGHLITAFNRLLDKLNEQQAALEELAHHDTLTGLPNRLMLADRLELALAQARRNGSQIALLFMDLDGFKRINDSLGHDGGDEALCQVAQRLQQIVRKTDTLARIGGDEFVLLMTDLPQHASDAAHSVAGKCIAALQPPLNIADQAFQLGLSIGITIGNADCQAEALLLQADKAMYQVKHSGGGRYLHHQN